MTRAHAYTSVTIDNEKHTVVFGALDPVDPQHLWIRDDEPISLYGTDMLFDPEELGRVLDTLVAEGSDRRFVAALDPDDNAFAGFLDLYSSPTGLIAPMSEGVREGGGDRLFPIEEIIAATEAVEGLFTNHRASAALRQAVIEKDFGSMLDDQLLIDDGVDPEIVGHGAESLLEWTTKPLPQHRDAIVQSLGSIDPAAADYSTLYRSGIDQVGLDRSPKGFG